MVVLTSYTRLPAIEQTVSGTPNTVTVASQVELSDHHAPAKVAAPAQAPTHSLKGQNATDSDNTLLMKTLIHL